MCLDQKLVFLPPIFRLSPHLIDRSTKVHDWAKFTRTWKNPVQMIAAASWRIVSFAVTSKHQKPKLPKRVWEEGRLFHVTKCLRCSHWCGCLDKVCMNTALWKFSIYIPLRPFPSQALYVQRQGAHRLVEYYISLVKPLQQKDRSLFSIILVRALHLDSLA